MKDEIKEILDEFLHIICTQCNYQDEVKYSLTYKQMKVLLDYITNLQEENKEWSMIFDTFSKRPYAHKYLEEKRKELNNDKIVGLDSEMIYKDYYDYKSRNEKAIEYIKENICDIDFMKKEYGNHFIDYDIETTFKDIENLLNILGGDDNE